MAQEIGASAPLFNSPLETGVRSVVLLNAAFPRTFDLAHLTWLDHLVVHTGDIGGPESLHPDIPQRAGELLVRRTLVEEGLKLMRRLHLVDVANTSDGILFTAREEASAFVENLRSPYAKELKERAVWLSKFLSATTDEDLSKLIAARIGWQAEFMMPRDKSNGSS